MNVDLLPSSDQAALVSTTAGYCRSQQPIRCIRERQDEATSMTGESWSAAAQLGLLGISVAEEVSGAGLGFDDEALAFCELGRALAPGPFVGSVLGAHIAAQSGGIKLATEIVTGGVTVGIAVTDDVRISGESVSASLRLIDSVGADFVVVSDIEGAGLVRTADLDEVVPVDCIDPGSRLATAVANGVRVVHWVPAAVAPVRLHGLLLVAAFQVGIAQATMELAVEYAKTRIQFGRPIGVNQAVKHRCADMAVCCDAARQQTLYAAVSLADGGPDAQFQVLAAKTVAGAAALDNASAAIQVLGGIGFTWEHDVHLYLKRNHVLEQIFGPPRLRLAELLAQKAVQ